LRRDGWVLDRTKGSHEQYVHPAKPGCVTIAGHDREDVPIGTLKNILRQAGFK